MSDKRDEVVTRLRNAFALTALEFLDRDPASVSAAFAPPFSSMTADDWRRAVSLWREHAKTLLADLPHRPCPGCGRDASRYLFDSYDAHAFHECLACGCWYTPKVVDWAVFERLFALSPEAGRHAAHMMDDRDQSVRNADMARIGAYLDDLLPLLRRGNTGAIAYLDAGCGVGHSLRAGLDRGLVVQGVEVDSAAVDIARHAGLPVATPDELAAIPPGPYQLLTFWETLEHIATPLETIQQFLPFLAPNGLVAITVPNLNALATRTMREACPWVHGGYNTPGHVNLFHVPAVQRLLERAGLVLLEADGQFSADPVELIAFLLGETRGAFDALDPGLPRGGMSAEVTAAAAGIWPGAALIERLALASPILRLVACRKGAEDSFREAIQARSAARRREIASAAQQLLAAEADYKAMSEALQQEVDRRDEELRQRDAERTEAVRIREERMLALAEERTQAVGLRDTIISDLRTELERLTSGWRRMINGRPRV